jgi:hypothetical protein
MTRLRCAAVAHSDTPMVPVKGHTGLAWVVVLAMFLVGGFVLVVSAFSQNNDPTSVDGRTATTSHNIP